MNGLTIEFEVSNIGIEPTADRRGAYLYCLAKDKKKPKDISAPFIDGAACSSALLQGMPVAFRTFQEARVTLIAMIFSNWLQYFCH